MAEGKCWHEDDATWAAMARAMFNPAAWEAAAGDVERIVALTALAPGAAVLDMACGPGRHALEFARRGFRVAAVDRTAAYLDEGRGRAAQENLDVEFVQADMREFRRENAFDVAVILTTSFGFFEDAEDDRRVAANLFASLKPGGRLVMDLLGKEIIARDFRDQSVYERDGLACCEFRKVEGAWSRLNVKRVTAGPGVWEETFFSIRLYAASELTALLGDCGFGGAVAYGDLAASPYDHKAKRLVVVATK